ncbi:MULTISPECIES: MalY/PatB family protein [unclassified Streptomyces]|uniref:MalY/PatB family protein n=1 Tax=unclassified Streptomyces TaxID=2593676 RepID=UPI0036F01F84
MIDIASLDTLTPDHLHGMGGLKWSTHPEALPAWVAEMDFGCAPPIVQALHEAVDSLNFGYLPPAVSSSLSSSCATWLQRCFGWDVPADQVRPVADVLTAFQLTIKHFTAPGSAVVVPTPSYTPFLTLPPELGRRVIEVPLRPVDGRWILDPDDLDKALADGAGLVVVCDPHNPTGTVCTAQEHLAVAEVVERHGARVFSDAIHAPIIYPGHSHVPYASVSEVAAAHTVSAVSAAKGWNLAGLKAAQVVFSNPADAESWHEFGLHAEVGASTFGMIASTAAYSAGGRWLESVVDYLDTTRHHIVSRLGEELPQARVTAPEGTYFTWLDLRAAGLGAEAAAVLRDRAGVTVTDGNLAGDGNAGFVRFNFATPRPIVDTMLDRIVAVLA